VLHPAGARHDLLVLGLLPTELLSVMVEDHAAGAGRALVDGCNELRHMRSLAPVPAGPEVDDPPGYPREWEADIPEPIP
jgi:hypothetical protein